MAATSPGDQGGGPGRAGRMARLGRELQAEVRRRRAEGSFPPSLEGALDRAFQAVVPERASAGFPEALRRVEEASYVDLEVPTASRVPGGSRAKALLRSLMAWYLNYLADQVNRFAATTLRALRLLEARVADLEEEARAGRPLLPPGPRGVGADPSSGWADLVRARLAGAAGPVLHAECGTAALVGMLVADGLDAYGVDPRAELLDEAAGGGLAVEVGDTLHHLRGLAEASLGGLVLSGCVDRLDVAGHRELARLAGAKIAPGGTVVVIGTEPAAWAAARVGPDGPAVVEADLAPGRPLHPGTWSHLLAEAGVVDAETVAGPRPEGLGRVPAAGEHAGVLNANLARLEEVLCRPTSFAVVARRASGGEGAADRGPGGR